jgi:hypothetical protein
MPDNDERPPVLGHAKELLQGRYGMPEADAHGWLRQTSMDSRRTMPDVCEAVLAGTMSPAPGWCPRVPPSAEAVGVLRTQILTGARPPGSKVSLAQLARTGGWSRDTARKAAQALAGEGLLRFVGNEGYHVSADIPVPGTGP